MQSIGYVLKKRIVGFILKIFNLNKEIVKILVRNIRSQLIEQLGFLLLRS